MIAGLLARARRLGEEVLGVNARNIEFVYPLNSRRHFPRADDKLRTKEILAAAGIPVPRTLAVFEDRRDLVSLAASIPAADGFAIKPAQAFGGNGIAIVRRDPAGGFVMAGPRGDVPLDVEAIRDHLLEILSGVYSLEKLSDRAFLEELLEPEEILGALSYKGLPDVRLIVCRGRIAMAMARVPTKASLGRANLHQGALGIGVDPSCGSTTHGVLRGRPVDVHPDGGTPLGGTRIPAWRDLADLAVRSAAAIGLGYLGVDVVIDGRRGPLVLEVNARPGLTIQIANRRGLVPALAGGGMR
ncbi:MAG: hypothetical protein JXP34_14055 [Planctomycetes bacterium]|nr:hypothetical protein [Planctomycetota bacterium]